VLTDAMGCFAVKCVATIDLGADLRKALKGAAR